MKDTLLIIQTLKALPARVGEGCLKPLIPLALIARMLVILMVIKIMTLKSLGLKCATLGRLRSFPSQCLLLGMLWSPAKVDRERGGPGRQSLGKAQECSSIHLRLGASTVLNATLSWLNRPIELYSM